MNPDVIVVGAGPTGLLLAGELALAGVRTRIVERRCEPQHQSRALSLHPRSVEVLDQRGIADRFLAAGRTVPGWHFAALETQLDFSALDSRHGCTLFLAQARTEALLEGRARELGVEILRGHETAEVRQGPDGVEVDVRVAGVRRTMRSRYVVGCDGARSVVRTAAGIGFPGTDETLTGMLGDFGVATADPGTLERARARGVLAVGLEDGLTRFVLLSPPRMRVPSSEPVTVEEFRSALRDACGSDCGIGEPRWLSRFGNATRLAESYRAGRVLLAGDAAHIHFPAAGQGLNTGLQDAMNLGWKLAAEINGWAPPGLLDTYHAERHPVGQSVTENTEVQTLLAELALVEQYERPARALRRLIDDLLGLEQVNRRLAGAVSAIDTAYPSPGDPLTGRRMPDVALVAGGSGATGAGRVYELLHEGRFVLLGLDGDAAAPDAGEWAARVTSVSAARYDAHPVLDGLREILIRPDGHVAWATRTADGRARRAERTLALTGWAGKPPGRERG
ncbi:Pentachlorophenol monooxygenase [Actinobacteria bacterium OV450]|nr:Pentachlorophenol monooxygenase [Actinobacteria bacterium OV450]